MNKLIVSLLLLSNVCSADVSFLTKGQPAQNDGYLFGIKEEQGLRLTDAELTYQKGLNLSLTNINKGYETQMGILQARLDNKDKQIASMSETKDGFFSRFGFFLLGCLTTTAVAYSVVKVVK